MLKPHGTHESLAGKLLLSSALVAVSLAYGWWQRENAAKSAHGDGAVRACVPGTCASSVSACAHAFRHGVRRAANRSTGDLCRSSPAQRRHLLRRNPPPAAPQVSTPASAAPQAPPQQEAAI